MQLPTHNPTPTCASKQSVIDPAAGEVWLLTNLAGGGGSGY